MRAKVMSYAAKPSPKVAANLLEADDSSAALVKLLDLHDEHAEVSDVRWSIRGTLLFSMAVSAALWAGIYWLITLV